MNESLRLAAMFVRDLLDYDEQLIKIGRLGEEIDDFTINYIGVDALGASLRLASGQKYDNEEMSYGQQWIAPVTLSFYGDEAWDNATRFSLLIPSQKSFELQQSLKIGVFQASQITDVKILTGQQYGNRYELTLNVQYSIGALVETLRIDTARLELITEHGTEIQP